MESVDPTLKKVNDKKTQLQTEIYFSPLYFHDRTCWVNKVVDSRLGTKFLNILHFDHLLQIYLNGVMWKDF